MMVRPSETNERIWLSQATNQTLLLKAWNDPNQKDVKDPLLDPEIYELANAIARGEPVDPAQIPDWFYEPKKSKPVLRPNLAHLFHANAFTFISPEMKAVLDRFDMGGNLIKPVTLMKNDRETVAHEGYCVLYICHAKDSFLPEKTPAARRPYGESIELWNPPLYEEDPMCFSRAALEGPDLWVEKRVLKMFFFFSDRLLAALREADLVNDLWELRSCPVMAA